MKSGSLKWLHEDNHSFLYYGLKIFVAIRCKVQVHRTFYTGICKHFTIEKQSTEKSEGMCMKIQSFLYKI